MKKNYEAPTMEVMTINPEDVMMVATSNTQVNTNDFNQRSHGHRGEWGNLWYEGEE